MSDAAVQIILANMKIFISRYNGSTTNNNKKKLA